MSTLNKEEILNLIRDIFDEKFKEQETTLISFVSDNNKLLFEKLDVINKKIVKHEERLQFVEKPVKDMEESLTVCKDIDGEKIKNIEKKMVTIQGDIKTYKENTPEVKEIGDMKEKMREMEDRSRRNNLRIDGIDEVNGETWDDTEERVLDLLENRLQINNVRIERAHRIFRKGKNSTKPRSIIIKLLDYKDKKLILDNAKKMKGSGVYIYEDFSAETMAIRNDLWPEVKRLRDAGKFAILKYDKIYKREHFNKQS